LKKKILIFGGSGLLGKNFIDYCLKKNFTIIVHENKTRVNKKVNKVKFELNTNRLENFFSKFKKNEFLVFSFIGMTSIEFSEQNKKNAFKTNFLVNKKICDVCKKTSNKFIFISTDHIFTGKKRIFYTEKAKTKAVNYYAKTKIEAENYIKRNFNDYLIIRSNFLCKGSKKNKINYKKSFSDSIVDNLKNNKQMHLWSNVFFTPIHVKILFELIFRLIVNNKKGIFHISSSQIVSKFNLGISISKKLKLNEKLILPNNFDRKKFINRPKYMTLSNKKIKKLFNLKSSYLSIENQINMLAKDYKN
jgi:dTDP-4-dehydrorhamnose reductase